MLRYYDVHGDCSHGISMYTSPLCESKAFNMQMRIYNCDPFLNKMSWVGKREVGMS